MQEFNYYQPASLAELSSIIMETGGRVLAGGTDIIPRMRRNRYPVSNLIDASKITELQKIEENEGWISIGALTTHLQIINSSLLQKSSPSLIEAAMSIGSPQTRSRGTIGGNICNASPAADLVPPLLSFDAEACIYREGGQRYVPLKDFFISPGKTILDKGEILKLVRYRNHIGAWGSAFLKLGRRNGMAVSIASAAVFLQIQNSGEIIEARIGLGSVAPMPVLSSNCANVIIDSKPDAFLFQKAAEKCVLDIYPISDVRSTAEYRKQAAVVLVKRALILAAAQADRRRAV